jgi:ATP-binding protein involved in chromosome partitioning
VTGGEGLAARVRAAVGAVKDPEIPRGLADLGMLEEVVAEGGAVTVSVALTSPSCPRRERLAEDVRAAAAAVPGVVSVEVRLRAGTRWREGLAVPSAARLRGIRNVIAVAAGKGGVGKSTVAANLALALREDGARVGLLDADIYGPSQPLMFGLTGRRPEVTPEHRVLPLEAHGVKVMSMGFLLEEGRSVVWRGPMIHKALAQFFDDILWGDLDYLVVDLPPGTGDAQLSLSQLVPVTGTVLVTTPQEVSLLDVRKAADMFRRVGVPILGVIENMSTFVCPCCRTETAIFDRGGGARAAKEWGVPLLGGIPIDPSVRASGDSGVPVILSHPESAVAEAFRAAARAAACRVSVEVLTGKAPEPPAPPPSKGGFEV